MAHLGGGLHRNSKTLYSFDTTTKCRRKREGRPCHYCYVNVGRDRNWNSKKVFEHTPYNGFVQTLARSMIQKLNALGGIRMFSYADYIPDHDEDVSLFLDDCSDVGLHAKAITKETDFISKYASHDAIMTIHVSVDSLPTGKYGSPISLAQAKDLRYKYPRVLTRAVVLDHEDLEEFGEDKHVDILTLNHEVLPSCEGRSFHLFSRKEVKQAGRDYPGRVCASGPKGKCPDCPVRCGVFGTLREKINADDLP